jgi:hypothetical protein
MNANWMGLAAAAAALVLFLLAWKAGIGFSMRRRLMLAAIATLIALPGLSFAFYYTHLFPEAAWYYEFRSWSGSEWFVSLVGIAGGLAASILPRRWLLFPLLATTAFAVVPFLKPLIAPMDSDALGNEWDGPVCLQSTGSTCGAASLSTVLGVHDIRVREKDVARAAHSYGGGTEAWYLARFARRQGAEARFTIDDGFAPEGGLPAIAGVKLGTIGHFIAILGEENGRYLVGDPMIGPRQFTRLELEEHYTFTGFHLRVERKTK